MRIIHNPEKPSSVKLVKTYVDTPRAHIVSITTDDGLAHIDMSHAKGISESIGEVGRIGALIVDDSCRGHGYAKRLLRAMIREAVKIGLKSVVMDYPEEHVQKLIENGWQHRGPDFFDGYIRIEYPITQDAEDKRITDLGFSVRVLSTLRACNIERLSQLLRVDRISLLGLRNFGKVSLREIDQFFEAHGYQWGHEKLVRLQDGHFYEMKLEGDMD